MPVLDLLAQRTGAKLALATHGVLPQVAMDRLRIQHVLFTLVQNALEAPTSHGEPASVAASDAGRRRLKSQATSHDSI
jgi:C4-dicarboxylate-specific signal transduction histidine kinase